MRRRFSLCDILEREVWVPHQRRTIQPSSLSKMACPASSLGLQGLPYEMMANIVMSLSIEEIFDLSLCCRHFQYLITEDSFCKSIVHVSRPQLTRNIQRADFLCRQKHSSPLRCSKQSVTVAMRERCDDWPKDEEPSPKLAPMS